MSRVVLCAAVAAALAVPLAAEFGRAALHPGKVIRLADGRRYELLGRDCRAAGYWWVQVGRTIPDGRSIVASFDGEDLEAAERGEFPPFPNRPVAAAPQPPVGSALPRHVRFHSK